jgi:hypothetical protein
MANRYVISRRNYDDFYINLIDECYQLCTKLNINAGIFYNEGKFPSVKETIDIKEDILIVVSSDHTCMDNLPTIEEISKRYLKVIILTAIEGIESYNNIEFLNYGGDFLFDSQCWPKVTPQKIKDFSAARHWTCLSIAPRPHRLFTACYLLGKDLGIDSEKGTGWLRISNHVLTNYESWYEFAKDKCQGSFLVNTEEIIKGYDGLKKLLHGGQPAGDIYKEIGLLDNSKNFDKSLREFFKHTAVDIVNETCCVEPGQYITEKYQHTIYGYNLPILITNYGGVSYLRDNGFDMFDDVIDHSYDTILNHSDRIMAAINLNLKLLKDKQYAIKAWKHVEKRMDANHQYAKFDMYNFFKNKTLANLETMLSQDK